MRRSHERKRAWSVIWRALDGCPLNSLVDLSERVRFITNLFMLTAYLLIVSHIYTQIYFYKAPGARWTGRPAVLQIVPGCESRLEKRGGRAGIYGQTPSRCSPWPGWHPVARRKTVPVIDPFQFFRNARPEVRFERGGGISCWSPRANSGIQGKLTR